jgi:aspartate-semialdehyde dehydrogenase
VSARSELRVVVVGASGALGTELVSVLDERRFPAADLIPLATERSMGNEIEFRGDAYPLLTEVPRLEATDLVFLCAPPAISLDHAGRALRAGVPCVDLSGALAGQPDVPLLIADFAAPADLVKPLLAIPGGAAAAVALAVAPLAAEAGLTRLVATGLAAASVAGAQGVESLSREVLALFNQEEAPDPDTFGRRVAFDCLPAVGELYGDGGTELLGRPDLRVAATVVQVPTFHGHGISLALELERCLEPARAAELLAKAPGVAFQHDPSGPTTRAAVGDEDVRVGRLRVDTSVPAGLQLWVAADVVRLSAVQAVRLAEARWAAG